MLQSHDGVVDLLPALPSGLPQGKMKGLLARGGFVVDIQWRQGQLQQVALLSKKGNECILKYKNKEIRFKTVIGRRYRFNGSLSKF